MFQGNDIVVYDADEELTCPDCGSECEPLDKDDRKGGVAECQGCGIAFNFMVEA